MVLDLDQENCLVLTNIEEKVDPDQVDVVETWKFDQHFEPWYLKRTFRPCHRSFGGGAVVVVVVSIACARAVGVVVVVVVGSRHLTLADHKDQRGS